MLYNESETRPGDEDQTANRRGVARKKRSMVEKEIEKEGSEKAVKEEEEVRMNWN